MRNLIYILILCSLFLQLKAQDIGDKKQSTLVFHTFYNDFGTAQLIRTSSLKNVLDNHLWSKFGKMQMGFGLNYLRGITQKLDFVATLDGSSTDYLFKDGTTNGSSAFLLDFNTALNLKLLSDKHVVTPYISGGAGYSSYKGKSGFYLPVGVGVQFNLFNEAFVFANGQYRTALSSQVNNHFQYSIGVGASLAKKKKVVKVADVIVVPKLVKKDSIVVILASNIAISVKDEATGEPLPLVDVILNGPDNKRLTAVTDTQGKVVFSKMEPADYSITGLLNHISTTAKNIVKGDFGAKGEPIYISLNHNDPRFTLEGIVVNKTKNIPEGGADIQITNTTIQSQSTQQSDPADGRFKVQLAAESEFTIVGKKAGYISNIEKVSTRGLNRSTTLYVKLELGIEEAKVGQSIMLRNINFELGKATLKTEVSADLDRLVQFLKDFPEARLEIQGHTDNVGNVAMNNKLSESRANSIVYYLAKHGIDVHKLSAKGFGPSFPIADNATAKGRAINRRVEMKVVQ